MLWILICAVNLTVCFYCVTCAFQSESTLNKSRPFWLNGLVFVYDLRVCGFQSRYCHLNFRYRAYFELGVLNIQVTIECIFTLKCVCVAQHLKVNQCKNSTSILKWFSALENKNNCILIKFDIRKFYHFITEDILRASLSFANECQDITEEGIHIIDYCLKSLLLNDNQP